MPLRNNFYTLVSKFGMFTHPHVVPTMTDFITQKKKDKLHNESEWWSGYQASKMTINK